MVKRLTLLLFLGLAQAQAAEPGKIMHFVTEPFPPFTFEQGGYAVGPMVDVLNDACKRLSWRCQIEVMPWRRALTLAESGKVDGIFTVVDIPERRAVFHLSVPVVNAHYALYSTSVQPLNYHSPADLAGREIGVYGPSATSLALQSLTAGVNGVSIKVERDNLTALKKLAAGRYGSGGVVMANRDVANWLIANNAIAGLKMARNVKELAYSFGLSRSRIAAATAGEFNRTLVDMCKEGRIRRIVSGYRLTVADCSGQ